MSFIKSPDGRIYKVKTVYDYVFREHVAYIGWRLFPKLEYTSCSEEKAIAGLEKTAWRNGYEILGKYERIFG